MNTFVKKFNHWLLILGGSLVWLTTMVKSGWVYDYCMGFWGPNGHDGIWHIALASSLARGSLEMPIFAGAQIQNYHLGFDLLLAGLHTVTRIPIVNLYFQILPVIFSVLIGWLTFKLTKNLWSVFFVYFGGSLGWVFGGGESMFWSAQAISTLLNPPFALSLIFILWGLLLIQQKKYWWAGLVFAVLPHIKIYAGILSFAGLLIAGFKDRNLFKTLGLGLLIYLPSNYQLLTTNSKVLEWQPGWFLETLMALSDRFNWPKFYQAMINYRAAGNWPKAILAYTVAFGIFFIGNVGTRIIGLFKNKDWFYLTMVATGLVIPMFFVQKGTAWNTIQFFYYSLFALGILAGISVQKFPKLLKLLIIILTLPTTWQTMPHYLPQRPPAAINKSELEALNFLSRQEPGIVLSYPAVVKRTLEPRPLYEYESTAYVSALSNKPSFWEDEVNLNITGYDWPARKKDLIDFWETRDDQRAWEFIRKNKIKYIYLPEVANNRPLVNLTKLGMVNVFENSQVAIWSVK